MNKQQLASKIWASANKMRSKIEANEYKDYILGFIFYRYLSSKIENFYRSEGWSEEDMPTLEEENDPEYTEYVRKNRGYFIGYKNLFSTWLDKGTDFGVKDVSEALSAFNRLIYPTHKKVFSGIFNTLETGLKNLGDSDTNRSTAIRKLIQLIKDIPMDGNQGYDVLGYIYEYLISNFAASAGKKAGEFYTPHEVSVLMAEIVAHHLRDREKIEIYDPTSGSGSLLITIGRAVAKHNDSPDNIKYYAQELKRNTYNLTRMNLVMRGIKPNNIITRNGDTLEHGCDWPMFEDDDKETSYEYKPMDAVVSNPPYSQEWDRPSDKDSDPRYKDYGLAPKKKADYAFLLHDLYHLKSDGIMAIVLPHGVLFRPGEEAEIRKNLIEKNKIEAIIGLPADIFFGTPIATIIMVLKANRDNNDVLFIDASKYASKDGKKKKLQASDIKRIFDAVTTRSAEIEKFARLVSLKEIRENEYDLNIPKYVDSSDAVEKWDLYSSLLGGVPRTEIDLLKDYWDVMPALKSALFPEGEYVECLTDNISDTIQNHDDIKKFQASYNTAFGDYEQYLIAELIDGMMSLNVAKEVDTLGEDLFRRLSSVPLLDRYAAFQALSDCWEQTATDIEIIQTEGREVLKKIEPNMVIVKNGDEEDEVQKGWKGRIMPFDLVQRTLLSEYLDKVNELTNQLAETVGEVSALLEEACEDDAEILTEDGDAFDSKKVKAQLKLMLKEYKKRKYTDLPQFPDGSMEAHIIALTKNVDEQKQLKAEIKDAMNELEEKTIFTIESLSEDQIRELLRLKWVMPVVDAVKAEHIKVISTLIDKVEALVSKYAVTLNDVEKSISDSESKLSDMVASLRGNDFDMKALESLQTLLNHGK